MFTGDAERFEANWSERPESKYLHWTRTAVKNQIQLAFRNHWDYLRFHHDAASPGRVLEVGSGRGSLSAYFSDAGWDCTLLDLAPSAVAAAKEAFAESGLTAEFVHADCLDMPFEDSCFDLVFSVGLLEHFEQTMPVLKEQARVLKPGGKLIAYVVPEHTPPIQIENEWVNKLLTAMFDHEPEATKSDVFRSDYLHEHYKQELFDLGMKSLGHHWVYPLPMISTSPSFPFTLLPESMEQILVDEFSRRLEGGEDRWVCKDLGGQAFFVFGTKAT